MDKKIEKLFNSLYAGGESIRKAINVADHAFKTGDNRLAGLTKEEVKIVQSIPDRQIWEVSVDFYDFMDYLGYAKREFEKGNNSKALTLLAEAEEKLNTVKVLELRTLKTQLLEVEKAVKKESK